MESLFGLTIQEIISGPRRSLKGLTPSLRTQVNLAWLNQESTWQEELYGSFPENPIDYWLPTRLCWQDQDVAWDFMRRVPEYQSSSYRGERIGAAGFVYCQCADSLNLALFHLDVHIHEDLQQDQVTIDLLPSKRRMRRLQALLLPLVRPYLDHRKLPVDLDWSRYYRNLDYSSDCRERVIKNHWKRFFRA